MSKAAGNIACVQDHLPPSHPVLCRDEAPTHPRLLRCGVGQVNEHRDELYNMLLTGHFPHAMRVRPGGAGAQGGSQVVSWSGPPGHCHMRCAHGWLGQPPEVAE